MSVKKPLDAPNTIRHRTLRIFFVSSYAMVRAESLLDVGRGVDQKPPNEVLDSR